MERRHVAWNLEAVMEERLWQLQGSGDRGSAVRDIEGEILWLEREWRAVIERARGGAWERTRVSRLVTEGSLTEKANWEEEGSAIQMVALGEKKGKLRRRRFRYHFHKFWSLSRSCFFVWVIWILMSFLSWCLDVFGEVFHLVHPYYLTGFVSSASKILCEILVFVSWFGFKTHWKKLFWPTLTSEPIDKYMKWGSHGFI